MCLLKSCREARCSKACAAAVLLLQASNDSQVHVGFVCVCVCACTPMCKSMSVSLPVPVLNGTKPGPHHVVVISLSFIGPGRKLQKKKKNMLFPHCVTIRHLTWFIGDGTLQLCIIPDIIKPHLSQPDTSWAEVWQQLVCVDFTRSTYFIFLQLMSH